MMDQRVQHVVSFIRENYQRKLTLKEMAETVNLSHWWLCHLFKNDIGTSPERFLAQVRLEKARSLLEGTFLSVKEVMSEVGMSDAGHFSKSFRAAYGVTPAKWREKSQENHEHKAKS
jgi:transcriptional regulator GlxA family with amidase domain